MVLVFASREQIHEAFDVIKLERMQEVMFVVRDPKKPDEPKERKTAQLSQQYRWGNGTIVCKVTKADLANVAADDSMEKTTSLLGAAAEKMLGQNALKKPLRGLGRNDRVTKRECLDPFETWETCKNMDVGSWDDKRNALPFIQTIVRLRPAHAKAVLEGRGQGGLFARETIRCRKEPKTKDMPVWADSKMDVGESSSFDATRERCESLHLQSTAQEAQIQFGVPCVASPTERGESENATN